MTNVDIVALEQVSHRERYRLLALTHDPVQYYAWCLRNGHHETRGRLREDWNAKIIWKMRMELEFQWDLVEDEVSTVIDALQETVDSELGYLQDQVKSQ